MDWNPAGHPRARCEQLPSELGIAATDLLTDPEKGWPLRLVPILAVALVADIAPLCAISPPDRLQPAA
jgi:hypothetical protein